MSLTGKAAAAVMKLLTGKPPKSAEELLAKARKYNSRNAFAMPSDKKAFYRRETIQKNTDLLIVRSKKFADEPEKAVLFIFGAGGTMNAWKPHLMMVRSIADRTNSEVFMPLYPLCTDASVSAAVETAYEAYRRILEDYSPERIVITGDSSGGACCLALISEINKRGGELPMPRLAILHSPSGVPHNDDSWERMELQSRRDGSGTMPLVRFFPEICRHGEEVPEYMIHPALGDYRNAPETYIYYSADETLASLGQDIEAAYNAAGAKLHISYTPGMMHCFSAYPAFPESRKACDEWIAAINSI